MRRNNKRVVCFILVFLILSLIIFSVSCKPKELIQEEPENIEEEIDTSSPFLSVPPINEDLFDYSSYTIAIITFTSQDGIDRIVKVALFEEMAPKSCENFIELAQAGHYDGTIVHRLIKDFMIQGGHKYVENTENDQIKVLDKDEVETIEGEFSLNGHNENSELLHESGVISMARADGDNTASDQFFICTASSPHLDGEYASFGKCVDTLSLYNIIELGKSKTYTISNGALEDFPFPVIYIKTVEIILPN